MIKFSTAQPENGTKLTEGFFRANTENKALARLLLAIPAGDFINREIASHLALLRIKDKSFVDNLKDVDLSYTLGTEAEIKEEDSGTFLVPFVLYATPR